ncbi:hypothetical protein JAAARDRAFT_87157, partial [Jaapia argillacea MUCL 33604]
IKEKMPAWLHLGAEKWTYNNHWDECLKINHRAKEVKDLVRIKDRIERNSQNPHTNSKDCKCLDCQDNRTNHGCTNPDKCTKRAAKILSKLKEKFRLDTNPYKDGLTLTQRRLASNESARKMGKGEILFDPSISLKTDLAECFRIFIPQIELEASPANRLRAPAGGIKILEEHLQIFTNGSCTKNSQQDAACSSRIWISEGNARNRAIKVPGDKHSNQIGELVAVICCLQNTESFIPVTILTD